MARDERTARIEWAREVMTVVGRLPAAERLMIKLVYVHGLPLREAAAWSGVDRARANGLLAAAMRHVTEHLLVAGGGRFRHTAINTTEPAQQLHALDD